MCGIFGFVSAHPAPFPAALARRVDRQLRHRGPDARGWLTLRGDEVARGDRLPADTAAQVLLLHRRLAILDLSRAGSQPMSTFDGRYHVVFNGEIFNFVELRAELENLGHRFRSHCDTEVLLAAWAQWGEASLTRLVGMFAFALVDTERRCVVLARDPLGIKPLYYAPWRGGIAFASEIATLLELPGIGRSLDAQRAYDYLRFNVPGVGESTFFADVKQLPAAHLLKIDIDRPVERRLFRYWRLAPDTVEDLSFDEAAGRLRELFLENVRLHTRSDVPVGVALSGGIDSSAIACSVRGVVGEDADLHSFSYFAENPERSDRRWAELAASASGANGHSFAVRAGDLDADFDQLLDAYQEPGSISINYLQLRLAACAQEAGVKVLLSGQGADEILAGYELYLTARLASLVRQRRWLEATRLLHALRRRRQTARLGTVLTREAMLAPGWLARSYDRFGALRVPSWINARWCREHAVAHERPPRPDGPQMLIERLRLGVLEHSLPGLLWGEDRGSMAYSVELRVPFVTPELVSFALALPEHHLIASDGTRKAVFRRAMEGFVPDEVLARRWKLGLALSPLEREFDAGPWLDAALAIVAARDGPVRGAPLRADLARAQRQQSEFISSRLWRVVNFARWSERFGVSVVGD